MPTIISLDESPVNVIYLERVALNCGTLFEEETAGGGKSYKLRHNKSNKIMQLGALNPLRRAEKDEFLPEKVYVRECMQEIFNKIVQANDPLRYAVVFGSPGVGKSVLSFLAALCCALYVKDKPVLFLRKTTRSAENVSVFWITAGCYPGELIVEFDRNVRTENALLTIHTQMILHMWKKEIKTNLNMFRVHSKYLRTMCDGPVHGHPDHISSADLVTSGGYESPKDEASTEIIPLPLSSWTLKEMIKGCRDVYQIKASRARNIYYVCGGNIRSAATIIMGKLTLAKRRTYIDGIIENEANLSTLKLALESHSLSSTEDSIDRLRAMFATPTKDGSYKTVQYIGSPHILRSVRSSLPLDETLNGLRYAKASGIQSLIGWHFELFGHKVFQVQHRHQEETRGQQGGLLGATNCLQFNIVEGSGKGTDSVKQLKQKNIYWTPSTSNFANIDAAIALESTLHCIQYTVSVSHAFNYRTFASGFWGELPQNFRQQIQNIVVTFVVPNDVTFKAVVIPKSQEDLCTGITPDGVELKFRNAKTTAGAAVKVAESSDGTLLDGDKDINMEEGECGADMDDSFADEDCDEELFEEEEETGSFQTIPLLPKFYFRWETRDENVNLDQAPLSFLHPNHLYP